MVAMLLFATANKARAALPGTNVPDSAGLSGTGDLYNRNIAVSSGDMLFITADAYRNGLCNGIFILYGEVSVWRSSTNATTTLGVMEKDDAHSTGCNEGLTTYFNATTNETVNISFEMSNASYDTRLYVQRNYPVSGGGSFNDGNIIFALSLIIGLLTIPIMSLVFSTFLRNNSKYGR